MYFLVFRITNTFVHEPILYQHSLDAPAHLFDFNKPSQSGSKPINKSSLREGVTKETIKSANPIHACLQVTMLKITLKR